MAGRKATPKKAPVKKKALAKKTPDVSVKIDGEWVGITEEAAKKELAALAQQKAEHQQKIAQAQQVIAHSQRVVDKADGAIETIVKMYKKK